MRKALILIIDPSTDTRTIYAHYFRHYGFDVVEAADAGEAGRLSQALHPDVIVTELAEETAIPLARPRPGGGRTPVIACSTRIDSSWHSVPDGMEVDSVLAKPAALRTLLLEVQRLLSDSLPSAAPAGN